MPFLRTTLRYYHTLKYLKATQIVSQVKFRLHQPSIKKQTAPQQRPAKAEWTACIVKPSTLLANDKAIFLNQIHSIADKSIWTDNNIDKLWLYNLHYFDYLQSNATDEQKRRLIERWIDENSFRQVNAWEPYTVSLRIVNWIKWLVSGNLPTAAMLDSLATQIEFLARRLETHILGNHLFANAKALLFAGCFFQGPQAEQWLTRGMKYFQRELTQQILPDGAHFELSPMYHAIILEDLLDVINIFKRVSKTVPSLWQAISTKMFNWLQALTHPDGDIAFFNDATFHIAPTLAECDAYQQRLSLNCRTAEKAFIYCKASGYVRAATRAAVLLTDIAAIGASYQPGHAHADTLSFELSLESQRIFVNSGISTYGNTPQRHFERGTSAHNTLQLNNVSSSDVWKSFRVARRAHVNHITVNNTPHETIIQASHDGYLHRFGVIHTRKWQLQQNSLRIQDDLSGIQIHQVAIYFHIHPTITIKTHDSKHFTLTDKHHKVIAIIKTSHAAYVEESQYHSGFNRSIPNQTLIIGTPIALPARFNTVITWNE